jgi:hypothetical protein
MSNVYATGRMPLNAQRVRRGFDASGPFVEYTYRGPKDYAEGIFATAQDMYDDLYIEHDDAVYTVVWRLNILDNGQDEIPQDEVRLTGKREERDILLHPAFDGITVAQMTSIQESISDNIPISKTQVPFTWPTPITEAEKIYNLAKRGVKSYPVELSVLTRTATASRWYQFEISYLNVGGIISPAVIVNHLALSGPLPITLPVDTDPVSNPYNLHWGWKKGAPDYSLAANRKAVYTQVFEYGLWPEAIHGALVTT